MTIHTIVTSAGRLCFSVTSVAVSALADAVHTAVA